MLKMAELDCQVTQGAISQVHRITSVSVSRVMVDVPLLPTIPSTRILDIGLR